MPKGTRWTQPEGGLFLWLELPAGVRDDEFFNAALERGVAVVPGSGFFAPGFVRLSYATSMANVKEGVKRIGEALAQL